MADKSIKVIALMGIVIVWTVAMAMSAVMKRIDPNEKIYPVYALCIASLETLVALGFALNC